MSDAPPNVFPLLAVLAGVASFGIVTGFRYSGRSFLPRLAGTAVAASVAAAGGWLGLDRAERPSVVGLLILLAGPAMAALVTASVAVAEHAARRPVSGHGLLRVASTALTGALLWFITFPTLLGQPRPVVLAGWAGALVALVAWATAAYGPGRRGRAG